MNSVSIILARLPNDGRYGRPLSERPTVIVIDFAGPAFEGDVRKTGFFVLDERSGRLEPNAAGKILGLRLPDDSRKNPTILLLEDEKGSIDALKAVYRAQGWSTLGPVDEEDYPDYRHIVSCVRYRPIARAS